MKTFKKIIISVLSFSVVHAHLNAETIRYTNKTYLAPRPHNVNLALENSAGWHELLHHKNSNPNAWGGTSQTASFYQTTTNKTGLGKYFGIKNKNVLLLATGTDVATTPSVDFDLGLMVHNSAIGAGAGTADNQATLKIRPLQESYGATYTYQHNLDKAFKNLYFRLSTTLVHVETSTEVFAKGAQASNLLEFLNGSLEKPIGNVNAQDFLKNATMDGRDSATGFADIDLMLGYNLYNKEGSCVGLNVGLTIPTGNKVTGQKAFQAIYGNGRHFGLGGNLDLYMRMWGDDDHHATLHVSGNYRYLFEGLERRTLGIVGHDFGQYVLLLSTAAVEHNTTQLIPAANVLTQNVNVLPGSQFDGIAAFSYAIKGFSFDIGYNLYYRESESVTRKDKTFDATQYGIAVTALDLSDTTPFNAATDLVNGAALTNAQIDVSAATTPSQLTNKIYGGLAYIFKDWQNPLLLGVTGHYEFANNNDALETWQVAGKLGFSF